MLSVESRMERTPSERHRRFRMDSTVWRIRRHHGRGGGSFRLSDGGNQVEVVADGGKSGGNTVAVVDDVLLSDRLEHRESWLSCWNIRVDAEGRSDETWLQIRWNSSWRTVDDRSEGGGISVRTR